jgi:hypothetical protein
MSKFKVNVKLSGYEVKLGSIEFSVEGEKEDAQKISHEIERQLGGMIHAPTMTPHALTSGNGKTVPPVIDATEVEAGGNGTATKRKTKKAGGGGGSRTPAEDINFVHDSAKYGTPQMTWTTGQKAIWFLYIVNEQAKVSELTAYNIAKNFNKQFKASKTIGHGNVATALEKEKLKGANSTVGTNNNDGTTKYFLTQAGIATAQKLAKGEAVTE